MMQLDFTEDYVLENSRVRLEPLNERHISLLEDISKEENLWTYFLGASGGSKDFGNYIHRAIEGRKEQREYPFAVFDKNKNDYAGSTRFFDYQQELNTIRLGYTWYGQDYRGTGLNKNCKYLVFEFAFERIGVERVGLGAHAENEVSLAAMESVGCKKEGVVRNLFPSIHGKGRSDAILLGILKQEWNDYAKRDLKNKL
ncbi:GNAT family N-acetyltransferase [uncultured Allomuricauda sp.]|uniref:GNAT family N-acetyltransferase n=1 Tax=Flagellimonas sp. W118 TaxID=3410791 RepID=UPI00260593F1|nr:GNAT family protein [uncultured Allomuricauda sp.]